MIKPTAAGGVSASTMRERTSPALRLALVGLATLALLAVVALASRGGLGHGGRAPQASQTLLDLGFTLFMIVFVLTIPFAIWAHLIEQREAPASSRKSGKR